MAEDKKQRGVGSRNLPPDIKAKWGKIGKYCQTQFNAIQKEQGLDAGIAYINSTYNTKYPSGANAPTDTLHQVDSGANAPTDTLHQVDSGANAPEEGRKKIMAQIPDSLHRRLSIHSAVTNNSYNQIIYQLIHDHIPDYQITIK